MYDDNSRDIGIGFYTVNNTPKTTTLHKFVLSIMRCMGSRYAHVEALDSQDRFYGIYSGQQIHTMETRKNFDSNGKYTYYTINVPWEKHKKFFNFFSENKKMSGFNWSVYFLFTTIDLGKYKYFCSQLIAEALIHAGIFRREKWPPTHKITPDILFKLLQDSGKLLAGSKRVQKLRVIQESNVDEHIIDMSN